jgi:hypothetical protein
MSDLTFPRRAAPDGWLIDWCERGRIPDALVRFAMRQLLKSRLVDESAGDGEARSASSTNCARARSRSKRMPRTRSITSSRRRFFTRI